MQPSAGLQNYSREGDDLRTQWSGQRWPSLDEQGQVGGDVYGFEGKCTGMCSAIFALFRIPRVFQGQNRMFRLLWGVLKLIFCKQRLKSGPTWVRRGPG